MSDLDLSTTSEGSCAVVRVDGEIDLDNASDLSEVALAAMQEIGPSLVLDLSGVTFMDSTGLKVLLAVHKRAELAGGRLVLAGPTRSRALPDDGRADHLQRPRRARVEGGSRG